LDASLEEVRLLRRQKLGTAQLPATISSAAERVCFGRAPVQFPAASRSPHAPAWRTDHTCLVEALGRDRDVAPVLRLYDHTDSVACLCMLRLTMWPVPVH
jgi:hypothetical protein